MAGMINGSSFSGGERDALFIQDEDGDFGDISLVSGIDHPGDGRVFVQLDFDRDGFVDVALVNSNAPFLKLFRNRSGDRNDGSSGRPLSFVALELVGGNASAQPAPGTSPRTPIGARIEYDLPGRTVVRELRCGEGMGAHNSPVLLLGLDGADEILACRVRWPGGALTELGSIRAGQIVRLSETDGVLSSRAYRRASEPGTRRRLETPNALFAKHLETLAADEAQPLHLFVFMGTWCASCRRGIAPLRDLLERAQDLGVAVHGLSEHYGELDELDQFEEETNAPYEITALDPEQVEAIQSLCRAEWLQYAVPLYIVTDGEGRVLSAERTLPTLSKMRGLARGR